MPGEDCTASPALGPRLLHSLIHSICGCDARPRSACSRPPPRRTASPQWIAQHARPTHHPQRALTVLRCSAGVGLDRRCRGGGECLRRERIPRNLHRARRHHDTRTLQVCFALHHLRRARPVHTPLLIHPCNCARTRARLTFSLAVCAARVSIWSEPASRGCCADFQTAEDACSLPPRDGGATACCKMCMWTAAEAAKVSGDRSGWRIWAVWTCGRLPRRVWASQCIVSRALESNCECLVIAWRDRGRRFGRAGMS